MASLDDHFGAGPYDGVPEPRWVWPGARVMTSVAADVAIEVVVVVNPFLRPGFGLNVMKSSLYDHLAVWYDSVTNSDEDAMEQQYNTWRTETPKALGSALRALREEIGFTQADLAQSLGTTRQRLSRIEDGEVSAQVLLILRAVRLLGGELRLERMRG